MKKKQTPQQQLIETARQKIIEVFPSDEQYMETYIPNDTSEKQRYIYFSAIWYFQSGIINSEIIERLSCGGNMLTVGCGEGHLERLLYRGFNIPKGNIVTSDLYLDPKIEKEGFSHYIFDMTKPWPNFEHKFDYILFPESLGVALIEYNRIGKGVLRTSRFFQELDLIEEDILEGNLKPKDLDFFMTVVEMDVAKVKPLYEILKEAIPYLKEKGEIIVKHGLQESQQRAYIMAKLAQEYEGISFPKTNSLENLVLKL